MAKGWQVQRRIRTVKAAERRVAEFSLTMQKVSRMRERKNYEFREGEKNKMAEAMREIFESELEMFLNNKVERKPFSLSDDETVETRRKV